MIIILFLNIIFNLNYTVPIYLLFSVSLPIWQFFILMSADVVYEVAIVSILYEVFQKYHKNLTMHR